MKDIYAVGLGIAGIALGCAGMAVYEADKVKSIEAKCTGICKGINYIQENIDLNVPEEVASELMRKAAMDSAHSLVEKATISAKKEITNDIHNQVKATVKEAYKNVESDIKEKLEAQINLQTIDKIQNQVSEKVAKQIVDKSLFSVTKNSSTEDLVKACVDSGMASWEIERVLRAAK